MTKNWLILIITTILTVTVWIGISVFFGLRGGEVEPEYSVYTTPISTEINEEIINDNLTREEEFVLVEREELD